MTFGPDKFVLLDLKGINRLFTVLGWFAPPSGNWSDLIPKKNRLSDFPIFPWVRPIRPYCDARRSLTVFIMTPNLTTFSKDLKIHDLPATWNFLFISGSQRDDAKDDSQWMHHPTHEGTWLNLLKDSRRRKQVACEKKLWYTMLPDSPSPWEPVLVSLSRRGRKIGPCISLWPWLWTDPNDRYPIQFAPFPLVLLWSHSKKSRVRPTLTWKSQKSKVSYRPKCVDSR